jgi:transcriptional regulator with XRE-family HTH domain
MHEDLGQLIRERREALGLDQATLAANLDVRQQAVSGWENGRSRPRRATLDDVARVLSVDLDTLLDAGGYRPLAQAVRLPVRPLTRALPLDELTEERFEDLLTDVVATLHQDGHVSRYGGRGHKQHGIDILVTADGTNLATGQCKRHREFGPAAVERAINEVTITAPKNYLFLSRLVATPAARKEAGKHATWELWDGEDISRHIRKLPREQAVRIVDTYFPGHRESFLGISAPGPWLLPEEHFGGTRGTVFNHEWSLVGRQTQLEQLLGAAHQGDAAVAFLVGAGGVGKTRLLKAFADAAPAGAQIRILPGDVQVTAADLELLPDDRDLTIIIDDAHEIAEVTGIVAGIWRRNPNTKVILATRPYGLRTLKEGMARHGLLPVPHAEVVLGDLEFEDAVALAREALGGAAPPAVARRLAGLTMDSPLATVVGGVLIKQGQLEPTALEQDDNVRLHIMRGFRDALVNDPLSYDPPTRRAVLDAVAALQPFRTNEEAARTSLSAIVAKPYDELHKHLRSLENAGILRRRGEALRIVPDLLGDVILTEAAFDDINPLGTGYLARVEPLVMGSSVEHLFVNVSRVDWQVRKLREDAPSLADSLWVAFRARVEAADVFDRRTLAETLAKAAYFQPTRALELTRWLIDNPTDRLDGEHAAWRSLLTVDYNGVLEALPEAIKLAALTEETLPEALGQLWELAQGDARPTNPHPSHPLRVLCELAEFGVGKPIWFNDLIVDIVSTWFVDGQQLSPFDVLEPMLATEGDESSVRGYTITFQPFALKPQSIMRVRQRVIDLGFEELDSPDLRRSGAAAKALKSAVQLPSGHFGRPVSKDERAAWIPGILETINRLGARAAAGGLDPAVLVAVRDALFWHDSYGSGTTHEAAQRAVESIPEGVEALLGLMVHDGWGRLVRDRGDNFEAMEAKRLELIGQVVDAVTSHTDEEVVELLIARLRADREVFGPTEGYPGPLVEGLINARPTLAHAMLAKLRGTSGATDLDPILPVILGTFATHDPAAALLDIQHLLGSTSLDRRRSVAQAIGWNRGLRELHPGELDLLLELASDTDVVIRRNVVRAAQLLARTQKAEAIRLLARVRFGDSQSLADDYFMSFRLDVGISWDDFSDPELDLIRQDLITLPGIGEYSVSQALADRSETNPEWVVRLLQERIEFAESLDSLREYDALPYSWDNGLRIRDTSAFLASLNGVLAWIAENLDSWLRRKMGADLFCAVAVKYDNQVLDLLRKALSGGTENSIRVVAAVLHEAPRTFIWDQPDFVRVALHAADKLGDDARQQMMGALWSATISGVRSGTPGEPFPETIEQRDRSRAIAKELPAGSIERRFYADMAKSAERDLQREIEDDLPSDGRAW